MRVVVIMLLLSAITHGQSQTTLTGGAKVETVTNITPPPSLTISVAGCTAAYVNAVFSCTASAANGTAPYTWSVASGQLPTGLTLSSAGVISGTPTAVGNFTAVIEVRDATSATATASLLISVVNEPTRIATLPQIWANPHEADLPASGVVTKYIHTNGSGDYPCTLAGLQASMDDWAAAPPDVWWHVIIDDGLSPSGKCIISSTGSWMWKVKTTGVPTGFIVYESAHPNPANQTVCSHQQGIDLIGPSPRDPGCTNDIDHMWKLTSTSDRIISAVGAVDSSGRGASNIVVRDADIIPSNAGTKVPLYINTCDWNLSPPCPGGVTPTPSLMATHIGIERNYIHGDYNDAGVSATGMLIADGINIACGMCWIQWNYMEGMARGTNPNGGEGHAIYAGRSTAGVKIAHNFVEGSEINFFTGGGNAPAFVENGRGVSPSDFEIRENVWTKNPAWWIPTNSNGINYANCKIPSKNVFELKDGDRFLIDGNVLENSPLCAQTGQGATINVSACSVRACNNQWYGIEDVTFTNNVTRNNYNGTQTQPRSVAPGNGFTVSRPGRRWNFINNLYYRIGTDPSRPTATGTTPSNVLVLGSNSNTFWTCAAQRDSAGATSTLSCDPNPNNSNLRFTATASAGLGTSTVTVSAAWGAETRTTTVSLTVAATARNLSRKTAKTAQRRQLRRPGARADDYAIAPDPGDVTVVQGASATTLIRMSRTGYWTGGAQLTVSGLPTGVTVQFMPSFASYSSWGSPGYAGIFNTQTMTDVGDPIGLIDCNPSTFNTPAGHRVRALSGTNGLDPNGLTVVYGNAGPANETGQCSYNNGSGWPAPAIDQHNTYVFAGALRYPDMQGGRANLATSQTVQDNLVVAPTGTAYTIMRALNDSNVAQSGNAAQLVGYDTNSLVWNHMLFVQTSRPGFNLLRSYPDDIVQTNANSTIWGIANGICPDATATLTCLGMNGFMNGVSWVYDPPSTSDALVFYALAPSSPYKAGGTRQAHDGTDMGADMNRIRQAMHSTIYTGCTAQSGTCGTGPKPD